MVLKSLSLLALLFSMCFFLECDTPTKPVSETDTTMSDIYRSANFNPQKPYGSLSLVHKGKPIFNPGQQVESLDEKFSCVRDPNGDHSDMRKWVFDYYCSDPSLSAYLKTGSINGILFFSSAKDKGKIFSISGSWTIDADLTNQKVKQESIKAITEKLFPILKDKLELNPGWSYTNEKDSFTEYFKVTSPGESGAYWKLNYEVKTKN